MYRYFYIIVLLIALAFISCKSTKSGIDSGNKGTNEQNFSGKGGVDNSELFIDANKQKLLGNNEEAIILFNKCIDINPKDAASMFELSKLYITAHKMDEALELSKKAAKIDPEND